MTLLAVTWVCADVRSPFITVWSVYTPKAPKARAS